MLALLLSAKRRRSHCPIAPDWEDDGMDHQIEESSMDGTTKKRKKRKLRDGGDDDASVGGGGQGRTMPKLNEDASDEEKRERIRIS